MKSACVKNIERQLFVTVIFNLQLKSCDKNRCTRAGTTLLAKVPKAWSIHQGFSY
jgi:hypothetical protein